MQDYHLNFNFILLCFVSFLFASCGVKAPPLKPTETVLESYISTFTNVEKVGPNNSNQVQSPPLEKK